MVNPDLLLKRCWLASKSRQDEESRLFAARAVICARLGVALPFPLIADRTPHSTVSKLLDISGSRSGPIAYHLIGATLAIRFPEKSISNHPYSAADDQGGRSGDFQIGGTAFHVTVAPSKAHAARCGKNLRDGLAAFMIVDEANVDRARYALEFENIVGRVAVESVESFVGQNLSELADFATDRVGPTWGSLLRTYNSRVSEVETDGSLLIEVPTALGGSADEEE
ncbi:MAG TPA: DUF4928 family protein [Phycisphaerales bacterium]|nr:DUF4928 family protein [Phycisphaerales bacterium]